MDKKSAKRPKKVRGFVTMTFDCCHQGHFELLRGCRKRCDFLSVGLTTDEQARIEKRDTILTYEQRFQILQNCKWVNEVMANHGTSKVEMQKKLKFDILFSGDDYYNDADFDAFRREYPNIPVVFLPRHATRSSTVLIQDIMERFYKSQKIVAPSIYGSIFRQGFGKPYHITKCVPFCKLETTSPFASNDAFGFYTHFAELPRNWKSKTHAEQAPAFPMISGIHPNREILINMHLQSMPWCTYLSHSTLFDGDYSAPLEHKQPNFDTLLDFANHVVRERSRPCKIVQIVQRDGGITLEDWCAQNCKSQGEFDTILQYVRDTILDTLERMGIVHSDVHPRNILVDPKTKQVSLIDFGWVTSLIFELSHKEREAVQNMLRLKFDWQHFQKSLLLCPATAKWMKLLDA